MLPHKERLLKVIETCIDEIHKINPDKYITSEVIASIFAAINNHATYAIGIDFGAKVILMIAQDFEIEISKKLLANSGFVLNLSKLFKKMNAILGVEFAALQWKDLNNVFLLILTQEAEKKLRKLEKAEKFITSFLGESKFGHGSLKDIETTFLTRYIFSVQAYTLTHKLAYTYFLAIKNFLKFHQEFVIKDFVKQLSDTYFTRYEDIIEYNRLVRESYIESFKSIRENSEEAITNYLKNELDEEKSYLQHLYYYDKNETIRLISSHINHKSFNSYIVASEIEPVMFKLQKMELSMQNLLEIANLLCQSDVIMELWRQLIYTSQNNRTNVYESVDEVFDYYNQILRLKSIPEYLLVNKENTLIQLDGCVQAFDAVIDSLAIILPDGIVTSISKIRTYHFFLLCNLTFEAIETHYKRVPEFEDIKGLFAACLASSLILLTNSTFNSPLSEYNIKRIQQLSNNNNLYISDLILYGFDELTPIFQNSCQISDKYIELILISFSKFYSHCLKTLLHNESSKYSIETMAELLKGYDPAYSIENYVKSFSKYFA